MNRLVLWLLVDVRLCQSTQVLRLVWMVRLGALFTFEVEVPSVEVFCAH